MERDGQSPQAAPGGSHAELMKDLARGVGKGAGGGRLTRRLLQRRTHLNPTCPDSAPAGLIGGRDSAGAGSDDPVTPTYDIQYNTDQYTTPTISLTRQHASASDNHIYLLGFFLSAQRAQHGAGSDGGLQGDTSAPRVLAPPPWTPRHACHRHPATPAAASHTGGSLLLQRLREQVLPRQESDERVWLAGPLGAAPRRPRGRARSLSPCRSLLRTVKGGGGQLRRGVG